MPHMSDLYSELFSFEGSEFYSIESEETIEEYLKTHNDSIAVYKEDEHLFVLAEDENYVKSTRNPAYFNEKTFNKAVNGDHANVSIFIIGENSKTNFLLESLTRMQESAELTFKFKHYGKLQTEELINDVKQTEGLKKILILSDDKVAADSYDANVFVALIELSKVFPVNAENISYTTELLDSRNLSSVKDFNIENTIISNKMMSLLITQLALNKGSKRFFEKILTISNTHSASDFDFIIHRVNRTIEIEEEMHFESKAELLRTFYNTFEGKRILIGLIQDNKIHLLNTNQDEKEDVVIKPDDSFIYFKYMSDNDNN